MAIKLLDQKFYYYVYVHTFCGMQDYCARACAVCVVLIHYTYTACGVGLSVLSNMYQKTPNRSLSSLSHATTLLTLTTFVYTINPCASNLVEDIICAGVRVLC